ncbi:MAG TPA: response regulator [Kofleriaceae bacterium]|nr:response regulator [Kofleriaceae bacterium]
MTSKPLLLLVEDEEDSRETLKELLEIAGYQVRTAGDGRQALDAVAALGETSFVMLLDLFMPVMTGLEVIETLRGDGRLPATKIVITTSAPHHAPSGIPVCRKPIDLKLLLRAVSALA